MSTESLSERILSDLSVVFKRDPQIIEFDIIPVEDSLCNKSPVISVDHHIGLESWCVKHLYEYVYSKFINSRLNSSRTANELICEWTRALLLINPDLTTAWNARKELIESAIITPLDELQFSEIVLTRKPKSPDNFAHREWIIKFMLKNQVPSREFITNELRVSLDAACRYQRNYYAWSHRIWIAVNLCHDSLDILQCDLIVTRNWAENHISDYSCFHFRQFLFNFIYDRFIPKPEVQSCDDIAKNFYDLLASELEMLNSFVNLYLDQESLFMHRRFVLHSLSKWYPNELSKTKDKEIAFIDDQLSNSYGNCKLNQWQFDLIRKHVNYLKRILKWNFESL